MGTSDQMGISHTHTHTHTHTNLLPLLGQSNAWGQELLDSIDWAAAGLQGPPRLRPICSEYYTEPGCSPFAVSRTQHCNVVRGVVAGLRGGVRGGMRGVVHGVVRGVVRGVVAELRGDYVQ